MNKTWIAAAALVCAAAVPSAQQPAQTPGAAGAAPIPGRGGNQTVSVTGCLIEDSGSPTSPENQTAQRENSNSKTGAFVLTDARMSNDSPTGTAQPTKEDPRPAPSTAGAAAAAPSAAAAGDSNSMRYVLSAESTDLRPHVGHRVEVTGRMQTAPSLAIGASTNTVTGPPVGTSGANSPDKVALEAHPTPRLMVESVRMIEGACGTGR